MGKGHWVLASVTTIVLLTPLPGRGQQVHGKRSPEPGSVVRREVAETLAEKLSSDYAVAAVGKEMARIIRRRLANGAYDRAQSGFALARDLQRDLYATSHDLHLSVRFSPDLPDGPGAAPRVPSSTAWLAEMRKLNGGISKIEILEGNIGYLRIDGFPPANLSKKPLIAAFSFLANTDALIIDARDNRGGDPKGVAQFMSFLSMGPPYVVNTIRLRHAGVEELRTTDEGTASYGTQRPVFVLTSRATVSGGEELAYDIQAFKRGTVIGETTAGGANPTRPIPLGHHFIAMIPFGRAINPVTHSNWEDVGVKPDVKIVANRALWEAERLVVQRLLAARPSPFDRSILEAVAVGLDLSAGARPGSELERQQIVGRYVPVYTGQPMLITVENGKLTEELNGQKNMILVKVGPNRYKPSGLPHGYYSAFFVRDGRVNMLLEQPLDPMLLRKE